MRNVMLLFLDRPPRRTTSKTGRTGAVEDDMSVDDAASVCSNISDATSIYDEVEGKAENISIEKQFLF
jgi:hypothetical protein